MFRKSSSKERGRPDTLPLSSILSKISPPSLLAAGTGVASQLLIILFLISIYLAALLQNQICVAVKFITYRRNDLVRQ
jgi:hypothetical protein